MIADKQTQISILEDVMEYPEKYLTEGVAPTPKNLRTLEREALFMKLDLEAL